MRHEGRGWYGMLYSSGRTRGQHSGKEKKKKWLLGHHHLFSRSLLQKHDQHCTATIFPVHQEVHAKEGKLAGRYTEGRRASRRLSQPSSTKFVLFFCISFFLIPLWLSHSLSTRQVHSGADRVVQMIILQLNPCTPESNATHKKEKGTHF